MEGKGSKLRARRHQFQEKQTPPMLFERIKTPGIAHMAYLLADGGEALLVDPSRDIGKYLDQLRAKELSLCYVIETHRQEDFEMGGAALRDATGAQIVAGTHEHFAHADLQLADGEELTLGKLRLRALHVPGHTPESLCYAAFLASAPDLAWGVFTGDALFIGDTGRTDLTDAERSAENAGLLHDGLHAKIFPLGDQAQVFPAHGAGSACGANVADRDDSTLGIERRSNAAAVLSRNDFMEHKRRERMARPPYFRRMEKVNLQAGRPLASAPVTWLPLQAFRRSSAQGIVVDTRMPEAFAGGHLPGAYSIWLEGLGRYGGWLTEERPIHLLLERPEDQSEAALALARIGRDDVAGVLAGGFEAWRDAGLPIEHSGTISPLQLEDTLQRYRLLDVRETGEFEEGHIPGARHIFVGELEERHGELGLAPEEPLVVTCSVGNRASLAVSILRRCGYRNVANLLGGMTSWQELGLPMEPAAGE